MGAFDGVLTDAPDSRHEGKTRRRSALWQSHATDGGAKKKKANRRPGRNTSWSEVSNIDFGAYQLKQNRFAKRVKKEGILLVHDAPSRAPLKVIPEGQQPRLCALALTSERNRIERTRVALAELAV